MRRKPYEIEFTKEAGEHLAALAVRDRVGQAVRAVEVTQATASLSEYARKARNGTVVVTLRGKPLAALVPLRGLDWEDLKVSTNADFIAMMERSRRRSPPGTGIPLEEMRRRHGLETKALPRKSRARGVRRA